VGIGTAIPAVGLDVGYTESVFGSSASSGYSVLNLIGTGTGSARYGSIRKNYDSPFDLRIRASNSSGDAPIIFELNNASTAMTLNSTALGVGVTPSTAWNTGTNLQIGSQAALYSNGNLGAVDLSSNSIRTGNDTYQYLLAASNQASRFQQRDGTFRWFNAPAGTSPNAITFTQAMTLDASGNLGVGRSPSYKLDIAGVGNFDQLRVSDTATINGQLTARQGEFPSAVRAAASDYAAVAFDGATASTRISSACQAIGTGAFSLWSRFRVPASNPASSIGIIGLSSTNSTMLAANAVVLIISSSGTLNFIRYGATTSDVRQAFIAGFLSTYSGQVVDVVVTRTGATLKIYVNGTDTAYTETTGGTPPAWSDTIASDFCNVGCFTSGSTTIFTGRIFRSVVFNRALSATDVTELITLGVNPADQWGTQTGQTSGTLVASKRHRITTYVSADSFTNVGAASNTTGVEFVATGTTPTTWTNASTLNRIGGLVDLDFTVGTGYQATDRSTNNLHGTLFNAVEFTQPKRVAVLYATTNTNGNQQMLATLAIPTNAIIEDIIVNSTGTATVTIRDAAAGAIIVNAASVVAGRQKLTIATPFSTTGNLWAQSSTTATLQFTILYTIAA
jgi:hypothetical protein